jgi:PAS domain S-box-containing protein
MNYLKAELYKLLQQDSEVFDFIQEAALDGLWYWDIENPENEWMNPKFWRVLGYKPEDMPHKSEAWHDKIHAEDLQLAKKNFERHCADASFPYEQVIRYFHKEGHTIWMRCRGMAIRDEAGKPIRMLGAHNEITELKKKELLLSETNKIAKIGYWEIDIKKGLPIWSEVTREIHEVPLDFEPNLEEGINFYREGYSRTRIGEIVEKAISEGIPFDEELELTTYTGKNKWVRVIGLTESIQGKCIRLYGLFQDIDEKVKLNEALETEKKRYQQIISGAKLGSWELNLTTNQIGLNSHAPKILGYTSAEFKQLFSNNWMSLIHPDDEGIFQRKLDLLKSKEINTLQLDCRVKRKTGNWIWLQVNAKLFQPNAFFRDTRVVGTFKDIGIEKETEEKLLLSEKSFRENFENAAIGMAILDTQGQWIKANEKLLSIVGYTLEELQKMSFEDITHPEDLASDLEHLEKLRAGEIDHYQIEKRYIHKEGRIVHILLGAAAVRNEKGEPLNYISQIVDISKRKIAENRIENLLHREQERTNRLNNFAHIVSHNLRTHSSGISKLLDFLELERPDINESEAFNYLHKASKGLSQTIDHLNQVVEIQGATKESFVACNLKESLESTLSTLRLQIQNSKIKIKADIDDQLQVKGLEAYLESIFFNFISNAIKYRDPNKEAELTIKTRIIKNWVCIYFIDNGLGIDLQRHKQRLFGMYNTFHSNPEARGLGLFLTENQVRILGGRIEVSSIESEGSEFKVYLPHEKD